jgi:hypothetical protein
VGGCVEDLPGCLSLGACGGFGGGGDHGRDPTWEVTVKGPNLMSLFVRDAIFGPGRFFLALAKSVPM